MNASEIIREPNLNFYSIREWSPKTEYELDLRLIVESLESKIPITYTVGSQQKFRNTEFFRKNNF